MHRRNQRLLFIAMLAAQAVVIGLIEGLLPPFFHFAPGAKLGLANLIILMALFTLPVRDSFFVLVIRLLTTTLLGGTLSTFMYSASGGLLSFISMALAKKLGPRRVSLIGISVLGGVMHNIGQLLVMALFSKTWSVMNYLPVLSLSGILAGFVVGVIGNILLVRVSTLSERHRAYASQTGQPDWLEPLADKSKTH